MANLITSTFNEKYHVPYLEKQILLLLVFSLWFDFVVQKMQKLNLLKKKSKGLFLQIWCLFSGLSSNSVGGNPLLRLVPCGCLSPQRRQDFRQSRLRYVALPLRHPDHPGDPGLHTARSRRRDQGLPDHAVGSATYLSTLGWRGNTNYLLIRFEILNHIFTVMKSTNSFEWTYKLNFDDTSDLKSKVWILHLSTV